MVLSPATDTINLLSGENLTIRTGLVCPSKEVDILVIGFTSARLSSK
jgi:hypothetical protein